MANGANTVGLKRHLIDKKERLKMKKTKKTKTWVEVFQSERKTWGNVNPATKVIPDKRFKKPKYKGKDWE